MMFPIRYLKGVLALCLGLVLAFAGLATSPAALAQSESQLVIEEIIVTARKREESAQDGPVAITALSAELENSTIRSLADLNGYAPNVSIGVDAIRGPGAASISIRGISPVRTDDNSFDSPVGVMVDGIYLGSLAGQVVENFDLERVEILRGPQGTLFGKNTVGGVLNVVRSRPAGELGARLKYTAGKWGSTGCAVLNAPIIEDTLSAKVFFTSIQSDGHIRNTNLGRDAPKKDYTSYGVAFLFTPNDSFEALLTVERFDDSSELEPRPWRGRAASRRLARTRLFRGIHGLPHWTRGLPHFFGFSKQHSHRHSQSRQLRGGCLISAGELRTFR